VQVSNSLQQEKEADLRATTWVLSGIEQNDLRMQKRALGVAIALLYIQSLDVSPSHGLSRLHPPAHERLIYCLNRDEFRQQEALEAFVLVILQLLFHEQGITADIHGTSFRTILRDFLFDIARNGSA
jgi:Peptidase U49